MTNSFNTGIGDLDKVITCLENNAFPDREWKPLGLKLGLIIIKLNNIEANYRSVTDCLRECLVLWLQQSYDTKEHSLPTMESLSEALKNIGLNAVASGIIKSFTDDAKINSKAKECATRAKEIYTALLGLESLPANGQHLYEFTMEQQEKFENMKKECQEKIKKLEEKKKKSENEKRENVTKKRSLRAKKSQLTPEQSRYKSKFDTAQKERDDAERRLKDAKDELEDTKQIAEVVSPLLCTPTQDPFLSAMQVGVNILGSAILSDMQSEADVAGRDAKKFDNKVADARIHLVSTNVTLESITSDLSNCEESIKKSTTIIAQCDAERKCLNEKLILIKNTLEFLDKAIYLWGKFVTISHDVTELMSHLEELTQEVQEAKEYEIFMSDGVTKITARSFLEVWEKFTK